MTEQTDKTTQIIAAGRRVVEAEASALTHLAAELGHPFAMAVDRLSRITGRVIVTGMGKSGHIARKIAATLASTGTPALYIHPGEASHGDLGMIGTDDIIIALSRSGETSELGDLIAHARAFSLPLIGITSIAHSTLATMASHALILPDSSEACAATNAPTTSTTMMLALGDAIAVALLERKGFTAEDFKRFHPGGQLGAMLRSVGDLMHGADAMPLVPAGTKLPAALEVMTAGGFGCVGVQDENRALIGIVTDGDIRRLVMAGQTPGKVDNVMTRTPITLNAGTRATEALATLNARKIMQVFVLDSDNRPIGIIHMHDFLRAGLS